MLPSISNYYEHLVLDEIYRQADKLALDQSAPGFVEDLACLALNQLPGRYIRHCIDLAAQMNDAERDEMNERVAAAVAVALRTLERRGELRGDQP